MDIINCALTLGTMKKKILDPDGTTRTVTITFSPVIKAALSLGKRTLNRYHSKAVDSEVYRIARGAYFFYPGVRTALNNSHTVLHPKRKGQHNKKQGWDADWIKAAVQSVRERWDETYKFMDVETGDQPHVPSLVSIHSTFREVTSYMTLDSPLRLPLIDGVIKSIRHCLG